MVEDSKLSLLRNAYAAFNARDIDSALATMQPDVAWPNGMEGGMVHGHEGVREYWTRQWGLIDPHVEPVTFDLDEAGRVVVGVHQVARNFPEKSCWIGWSSTYTRSKAGSFAPWRFVTRSSSPVASRP
ncbi:MAG: nuclear transport factor 2 family protein [Candidatus Sulfotelmatobacter sp.]